MKKEKRLGFFLGQIGNKGQGAVGIIVGLIVMVFLIGVIAWAFRPVTTGNVVADGQAQIKEGNFIGEPFELNAWVVSTQGVKLDISNVGERDYLVIEVEVLNCGKSKIGKEVKKTESQIFVVECPLNTGEEFDNIVRVKYQNADRTEENVAIGNVRDVI